MIDVKVPIVGESVTYAELTSWLAEDGAYVEKDQEIAEFDSDKASFTINAEEAGRIKIIIQPGKVNIGDVIAQIDTTIAKPIKKANEIQKTPIDKIQKSEAIENYSDKNQKRTDAPELTAELKIRFSPLAAKMAEENNLDPDEIAKDKILRITKNDVLSYIQKKDHPAIYTNSRETVKKELTPLRRKLAERLVKVKNETAMLTTYNEADMSRVLSIRKEYGERFQKKYGMKLGLMSFFAKVAAIALKEFPEVNAGIDGDYIVYHEYVDLGIAVSTEKGLMVPVIHNVESLGIQELENEIQLLSDKARTKKITIEEMTGGTFTISNGGVFGSLFSSPIINPPQAAILGMHKIQERPVGIDGRIELRPMMYLALSYDHRLIDGKDSVTFLVRIKELIEEPCKLSAECAGIVDRLLGI